VRPSNEPCGTLSTPCPKPNASASFADRQASLGDTQYLLAEITPLGFNWRCGASGYLVAFLNNVIDVERARRPEDPSP
jgi:sucrose-6-phosphatase